MSTACSLGEFDRTAFACPCDNGLVCRSEVCVPGEEDASTDGPRDEQDSLGQDVLEDSCSAFDFNEGLIAHYGPIPPNGDVWPNAVPLGTTNRAADAACEGTCPSPVEGSPGWVRFEGPPHYGIRVAQPFTSGEGHTVSFFADLDAAPPTGSTSSLLTLLQPSSCPSSNHNLIQLETVISGSWSYKVVGGAECDRSVDVPVTESGFAERHHWAFRWGRNDPNHPSIYLDGVEVFPTDVAEPLPTAGFANAATRADLWIGGERNSSGLLALPIFGNLASVRVYRRYFPPANVPCLANELPSQ